MSHAALAGGDAAAQQRAALLADALAPALGVLARPLAPVRRVADEARDWLHLRSENARLREENERLRQWHAVALALDAENAAFKAQLRWVPDPAPSFVTSRETWGGAVSMTHIVRAGWMVIRTDGGNGDPSEDLGEDGVEVGEALDGLVGRDDVVFGGECLVELLLELALHVWVLRQVVGDRAGGATG